MMMKLLKSVVQVVTRPIQNLMISYLRFLVGFPSLSNHHHHQDTNLEHHHHVTLVIEDSNEIGRNNVLYAATKAYLFRKINLDSNKVHVEECKVTDQYQGVELKWRIFIGNLTKESFELRFDKKHRDLVFNSYLPFVETEMMIKREKRILEMHTYSHAYGTWETKRLENPSTFGTIVMKAELKRGLIHDLDRFMRRKEFYRKVGRHWMRNYLVRGAPGTGKTSLVAAMANYLNFDVYDLNLSGVKSLDFDPRRLTLGVMEGAILVVEDIDCSVEGSVLSHLLSSLAGVCSYGEARIVIFTTKNMEILDPTLVCRMEMNIHMGHCSFEGFKTLASTYLGLSHDNDEPHSLYPDIKRLIDGQVVTPAQVAEELMKSQDVDVALQGLVRTLEMKNRRTFGMMDQGQIEH